MNLKSSLPSLLAVSVLSLGGASLTQAADAVAAVDQAFVAKVSQGGRYEVEASKLAQDKATAADVKTFAAKDVADHDQVNAELKSIAAAQSLDLAPELNADFTQKLAALSALSGADFDKAYIASMAMIHRKDEGIFAKEAKAGAGTDWKAFAAKTDAIVKGHIVALKAIRAKSR